MLRPSIKRRIVGIATGMIILAVITSVMSMALASRSRPSAACATGRPVVLASVTHAMRAAQQVASRRELAVGVRTMDLSARM